MSIDQVTTVSFTRAASSPALGFPRWLRHLLERLRDLRRSARDERIAAELPLHLRYDIGALDCVPDRQSRWQVQGSYQEVLEAQWQRGV